MTSEWSTPLWHVVYGADKFASILVMVRTALIAHHIPDRILQIHLQMYRSHDIYAVYQYAWKSNGNTAQLLQKRKRIWIYL